MQVTIDKFGRILVPKKIRELLQLSPGKALDLDVDQNSLLLTVSEETEVVIETSSLGLPIIRTHQKELDTTNLKEFFDATRAEYLDKKAGL